MIEAVYIGTLVPLIFLMVVIKGEYRKLMLFFAWGLTSALAVYFLNILIESLWRIPEVSLLTEIIPPMEELLKILPILFFLKGKKSIPQYNIVRFAMAAGIGFSILENYLYLSMTADSGLVGGIFFILTRSLTACLLHGSLSALTGFAVEMMRQRKFFSPGLLLGMFLLSSSIHSLYNLLGFSGGYLLLSLFIPPALFLLEIYGLNLFGRKRVKKSAEEAGS